ncbi:MAG: carboxypeptidase-like regulatory domain-containing protein [Bacteroidota bacterium]
MAIRDYNMPDADMFQGSRTKRQHFIDHKADFVGLDVDFDDPQADDWLDSIEASEGTDTAETRDDEGQQETAEVNEVMVLARKKHAQMKYFIVKAYGNKPDIMNKFGLDDYDRAGQSQKLMKTHLKNLHKQSNSAAYKPALLAANCTQLKIDEIETISNNLSDEDTEQNAFFENEAVATKARVTQYNTTFGFWHKVNAASKTIFYDSPELLNLFLFPRNTEPAESFNVLGKATTGVAATAVVGATVQIESLSLTTTTDSNGDYGFAAVPAGTYDVKFSKAGFVDLIVSVTVAASGSITANGLMVAV